MAAVIILSFMCSVPFGNQGHLSLEVPGFANPPRDGIAFVEKPPRLLDRDLRSAQSPYPELDAKLGGTFTKGFEALYQRLSGEGPEYGAVGLAEPPTGMAQTAASRGIATVSRSSATWDGEGIAAISPASSFAATRSGDPGASTALTASRTASAVT